MKRDIFIKILLLTGLFSGIVTTTVIAQWTPIKSMGIGPDDGCFSFSINGKGYVGGGSGNSHFYEYDTAANIWTLKGNAPGNKKRGFGFSFVANGKAYVGTGDTTGGNDLCSDVWMYDPGTNLWTQKSSFPGGLRSAEFCFVIDNIAYIGGGSDAVFAVWNDFYKYDPASDVWTPLPHLPFGAILFPSTFTIDNKGYVATGANASFVEGTSLWEYDPVGGTWTSKTDFPGAARQAGFGFSLGNIGYVGAGTSGATTVYSDVWRYNQATDNWTAAPSYPSRYLGWTAPFTIGNTAYVGTGSFFTTSGAFGTDSFRKFRDTIATTGMNDALTTKGITAYPNPAGDVVSITGSISANDVFIINDLNGRQVKTFSHSGKDLYIGDLKEGVYILKCISNTEVFTQKIIRR